MGMHVVMTGNPVDGFSIIGPFATRDESPDATQPELVG